MLKVYQNKVQLLCSSTAAVGGLCLDAIIDVPLALDLNNNLGEGRPAGVLLQSTHHLQELVKLDRARVVQVNLVCMEKKGRV